MIFEKQLKTIDEELKKTKENIFLANENILEKKAEMEKFAREVQLFTAPFNNMRTLKFEAQPTNGFFAAVNEVFGGSS